MFKTWLCQGWRRGRAFQAGAKAGVKVRCGYDLASGKDRKETRLAGSKGM